MKGLVIKAPWIDLILEGKKTWEIRGQITNIRGTIALIQSGTGTIVGTAELVDDIHLNLTEMEANYDHHQIPTDLLIQHSYRHIHAWVLQNAKRLETPIPYQHPRGAITWVNLPELTLPNKEVAV